MPTKKLTLSAVINTKNSASTLERTLKSLDFVDEIVVVDMESSDDTKEIAKKYTKKVFNHRDVGYADPARNFAISKASGDWLFVIDHDEVVTPELQKEIKKLIKPNSEVDVYQLPRKNLIFGKWMKYTGWWPDYQTRLFKKGHIDWKKGVHRGPDFKGIVAKLPAEEKYTIEHHNYTGVDSFLDRLNKYTSIQAKERLQQLAKEDYSIEEMIEIFANETAKRAYKLDGVKDGLHGVSMSLLQGMYEVSIYLKQWGEKGYPEVQAKSTDYLQKVQKIWNYWRADFQMRNSRGLKKFYWQIRRKFKL